MLQQNILIVDDHTENLVALEAILEDEHRNLIKANSGQEALTLAVKTEFALILLDVQMPDMDGFEVASLMRKHKKTRTTPIIFVTAINKDQQYVFKGYESGAVDYLFKPLDPVVLEHKVRFFLELDDKSRQLKQRIDEVMRLKEDNDLLLKSVGEAVIGIDTQGKITFANPAAAHTFETEIDSILGKNISQILSYDEAGKCPFLWPESQSYSTCSSGETDKVDDNIFGHKGEKSFAAEFIATPITRAGSTFSGAVFALRDITKRKEAERLLIYSARYDQLTGLVNRNYFEQILARGLARARRDNSVVGLMFLDLDHFKEVNDTLGHNIGDALLQQVAARLNDCVREADTLCRLGGDEFTLILESIHGQKDIVLVAEKLLKLLTACFYITEDSTVHEVHIGASIGMASYPHSANNVTSLLKCADIAMYQTKSSGRNSFQMYSKRMEEFFRRTIEIETRLRAAIDNEEFVLHYQPQINSKSENIAGIEALVRWEPKDQQIIYPDEFIPIAEKSGLIVKLGYWILAKACEDLKIIHQHFKKTIPLSVNFSIRQLIDVDICQGVSEIIKDSGIDPTHLNFEITESMVMENPEEKIKKLTTIKNLGVSISVDDFGTGYSSLTYIKRLPIDELKIDRAFIKDIGKDKQDEVIIKTIINMAQSLNLKVIAEGVETAEQLEFLKKHNCFIMQGYYYTGAIPLAELLKLALDHFSGALSANDENASHLPSSRPLKRNH